MDESALKALLDRQAIVDVFNRYAIGIDTRDSELYARCFDDELEVQIPGMPEGVRPATEWVDRAIDVVGHYASTQHIIANHTISIDGDRAKGLAYLQAQHFDPEPGKSLLLGGCYDNDFRRTDRGWRICTLRLSVSWTRAS